MCHSAPWVQPGETELKQSAAADEEDIKVAKQLDLWTGDAHDGETFSALCVCVSELEGLEYSDKDEMAPMEDEGFSNWAEEQGRRREGNMVSQVSVNFDL